MKNLFLSKKNIYQTSSPKKVSKTVTCLLITLCGLLLNKNSIAQGYSINTTGAVPDSSAMLDIISANKGLLIPRVSLSSITDSTTIVHPAVSLQVYNTNDSMTGGKKGFWYWNGNRWIQIIGAKGADSLAIGSNITTPLLIGGTTTTSSITYKTTTAAGTTGADHIFKVGTNGGTEAMRILNSGNVGIGTASPASKLDVEGGVSIGATYSGTTAAPTNGAIIEGQVAIGTTGAIQVAGTGSPTKVTIVASTSDNTVLLLKQYANTTALPILTFGKSRGTSIGSNVATSNNDYFGIMSFEGVNTSNNKAEAARIELRQDGSGGSTRIPSRFEFRTSDTTSGLSTKMTIKNNGNVGIGTTSPGYKLDVQGGDINASGSVRSAGTALTSDRRFKLGIDSIQSALNIIHQLKPSSYYFDTLNYNGEGKFNFCSQKQYGFIAQDVENVLPELVVPCAKSCVTDTLGNVTTPAYTYKTLNYNAFIPILTKGVQELQAQNAILQKQVSILEKRIQQLEGQ